MADTTSGFQPNMINWQALAALASGNTVGEQIGNMNATIAGQSVQAKETQAENATKKWLSAQFPGEDFSQLSGPALNAAYSSGLQRYAQAKQPKTAEFKQLDDGTYGTWDGQNFNVIGKAENRAEMPAEYRNYQLSQQDPDYKKFLESKSPTNTTFEDRKSIAKDLGMTPDNPAYQMYVATGKFPREDQQKLTAGDKAQLYELQDKIDANKAVIANLETVIDGKEGETLNDRAGSGWSSDWQAWGARNDPTGGWLFDQEKGKATTELKNIVVENSLGQLKAIFGSAPTEGERIVLRELEASTDKTPEERKVILKRAIQLAKRRLETAEERAASIRDESFYQPNPSNAKKPITSGKTTTGNTFEVLD